MQVSTSFQAHSIELGTRLESPLHRFNERWRIRESQANVLKFESESRSSQSFCQLHHPRFLLRILLSRFGPIFQWQLLRGALRKSCWNSLSTEKLCEPIYHIISIVSHNFRFNLVEFFMKKEMSSQFYDRYLISLFIRLSLFNGEG